MKVFAVLLVVAAFAVLIHGRIFQVSTGSSHLKIPALDVLPLPNAEIHARDTFPKLDNTSASSPDTVHTAVNYDPNNLPSEADWNKYANKGGFLRCLLAMSDSHAGEAWPDPLQRTPPTARSQWQGNLQNELRTWYWQESAYDQLHNADFANTGPGYNRIGTALDALGLNAHPTTHGGLNIGFSVEHYDENDTYEDDEDGDSEGEPVPVEDQVYAVGPNTYVATGAHTRFTLNAPQGAIYVQDLFSPTHAAALNWDHTPQPHELPLLHATSDILAGYWLRHPNPENLQYYFANNIQSADTLPLINKILKDRGWNYVPEWPGVTVQVGSREGDALLGSPIGATLAYLLLQHKLTLGIKTVSQVTLFRDYKADPHHMADIQLLFWVQDVDVPRDNVQIVDPGSVVEKRWRWKGEKMMAVVGNVTRVHRVVLGDRGEWSVSTRMSGKV